MKYLFLSLFFTSSITVDAQTQLSHDDSLLIGTWKGTSICQIRPSACKDEIAAYHITGLVKPNTYHMIANKVINGVEESMAESDFVFDSKTRILKCVEEKYKLIITYHLNDDKMEGTMTSLDDPTKIYRIIKLTKAGK